MPRQCNLWSIFTILAIWFAVQVPDQCRGHPTYENATALMKYVLGSDFDPDTRPMDNQSEPVIVKAKFALVSLVEVDDVKQQFTMNGFLGLGWQDQRVFWDPDDFGGIIYLSPQPKNVWRPRMLLLNTLGDRDLFKDDHSPLFIYDNGAAYWMPGGLFKASCGLNMDSYPFDTQHCFMLFCPMDHFSNYLVFTVDEESFDLDFFVANEGWSLKSSSVEINTISTGGTTDVFSCIRLSFTIKRRPGFFIINIILPVLLLSFLNNFVFVIPDEEGEKIGYGITVLLSLSVFLTTVSAMVPRSSNNIPAVSVYLFVLLVASVVSILASMLVVWLHHKEEAEETSAKSQANYQDVVKKVARMQRAVSKVDSLISARRRSSPEMKPGEEFGMDEGSQESPVKVKQNRYKTICKHINKVCFIGSMLLWVIINLTYFIYTNR